MTHFYVCSEYLRATVYQDAICQCITDAIERGDLCEYCHAPCWEDVPCHKRQLSNEFGSPKVRRA